MSDLPSIFSYWCQTERSFKRIPLHQGNCYCDPYCERFMDCCADYDRFCQGVVTQVQLEMKKWGCHEKIWIIDSCPRNKSSQNITRQCNNNQKITRSNYADVIPVLSKAEQVECGPRRGVIGSHGSAHASSFALLLDIDDDTANGATDILTTTKLVTCTNIQYYDPQNYTVLPGSTSVYINSTREVLTEKEYFANNTILTKTIDKFQKGQ
ncbi:hypothetical protein QZH41_007232 [Actinostola sp. cb2023]|nr:hypothetical protein QZH41_007232 [Actinostola sp. cb2023]